jgi:hypothetical protein
MFRGLRGYRNFETVAVMFLARTFCQAALMAGMAWDKHCRYWDIFSDAFEPVASRMAGR